MKVQEKTRWQLPVIWNHFQRISIFVLDTTIGRVNNQVFPEKLSTLASIKRKPLMFIRDLETEILKNGKVGIGRGNKEWYRWALGRIPVL